MLDRVQGASTYSAGTGPVPPAAPPPPPPPPAPVEEAKQPQGDQNGVAPATGRKSSARLPEQDKKQANSDNPYANSTGRNVADGTSTAADVAETTKDIRGIGGIFTSVGSRLPRLGRLTTGVADALEWVATKGEAVGRVAPVAAKGFGALAKAAPILGVGMAGLDIGKAIAEKDPEKKQIYKGTAAFSTFSSAAGIGGTALLATPLAPLGVGLIAAGIAASVVSFVDTSFLGGRISKVVGGAVDKVADAGKAVGHAVADAGKAVGHAASSAWHALTSL